MPAIEPCFAVEAVYAPDAATRRTPHREAHLARLAMLNDEGAVICVGAYGDLSASLLVLAVSSEEAAVAIVETDVYWKNKVWTSYTVRPLNRVLFEDA